MLSKIRFMVLALAAVSAVPALAQARRPAQATTTTASGRPVNFALGYKSVGTGAGGNIGGFHGRVGFTDRMAAGLVFVFGSNFDSMVVCGDFNFDVGQLSNHAFFLEGGFGYMKVGGNNLYLNILFGLRMHLFSNIDMSVAYGLQPTFIDANQISSTTQPLANVAIHWNF